MVQPLLVCVQKVMHLEPIFFDTLEEMRAHWQSCLSLNLVAKPSNAQGASKGRGKGPTVKVGHSKAGTSAQADKVENQLLDDDNVVGEKLNTNQSDF